MGLRPFRKRQSGNPSGRSKGYREFAERAREMSIEGLEQIYAYARDKRQSVPVRILAWKPSWSAGSAGRCSQSLRVLRLSTARTIRYSVTTPNRKILRLGGPGGAPAGDPRRRRGRLQKIKVFRKPMIRRAIGATEVGISQSFLAFRRLHPPPLLVYCSRRPGIAQGQPGEPDEPAHLQNPTRPHPRGARAPREVRPGRLQVGRRHPQASPITST
jgi:hypothetical protein